jgi:uncharacterized secreted repeat protein (TIGR03808 family)
MNLARRSLLSAAALSAVSSPVLAAVKSIHIQDEIDRAIGGNGELRLPAGRFETDTLKINGPLWVHGVPGRTELVSRDGGSVLLIENAADVFLSGLSFVGRDVPSTEQLAQSSLVQARSCKTLRIEDCAFSNSPFSGLNLDRCSGAVSTSRFFKLGQYGLFAWDSLGLQISNNDVSDIGNNGILIWRSEDAADGTQVLGNRIGNIRADAGGSGQNGNGINIFRAGNVITAHNHISDTAFSSIRYNSGSNAQISANTCLRAGEVAVYVEFSFEGAVVANNIIDDAAWGISITNFDVGGRLATCTGNIIRNIHGRMSEGAGEASGIVAEADTLISNNVVENVKGTGIRLGWGPYARNLMAQGNIIRKCGRGIVVSTSEGAGQQMVTGNMISGSQVAAIQGLDHNSVTMADPSVAPSHIVISNNSVTA